MAEPCKNKQRAGGCLGWGWIISLLFPFVLLVMPFPESTNNKAYPVHGMTHFDVLQHKVTISLDFDEDTESRYRPKGCYIVDLRKVGWDKKLTINCSKVEYRIDGSEWRFAIRIPEHEPDRVWFWSPLENDLELIDAGSKHYKMRPGRYDLRVTFEGADGSNRMVETTLTLSEKTEWKWTNIRKVAKGLSAWN